MLARCTRGSGAESSSFTHYNAGLQVFQEGTGSRVVWISDFLPNELGQQLGHMQEQGALPR